MASARSAVGARAAACARASATSAGPASGAAKNAAASAEHAQAPASARQTAWRASAKWPSTGATAMRAITPAGDDAPDRFRRKAMRLQQRRQERRKRAEARVEQREHDQEGWRDHASAALAELASSSPPVAGRFATAQDETVGRRGGPRLMLRREPHAVGEALWICRSRRPRSKFLPDCCAPSSTLRPGFCPGLDRPGVPPRPRPGGKPNCFAQAGSCAPASAVAFAP